MFVAAASMLFGSVGYGQSDPPAAHSGGLDFKQFGLLAIQDGGRRKPIDTFARETLIRITGRSTYTDKAGRKWQPSDFVLSALLDTRDWKNEPMILISSGELIEQLQEVTVDDPVPPGRIWVTVAFCQVKVAVFVSGSSPLVWVDAPR